MSRGGKFSCVAWGLSESASRTAVDWSPMTVHVYRSSAVRGEPTVSLPPAAGSSAILGLVM